MYQSGGFLAASPGYLQLRRLPVPARRVGGNSVACQISITVPSEHPCPGWSGGSSIRQGRGVQHQGLLETRALPLGQYPGAAGAA